MPFDRKEYMKQYRLKNREKQLEYYRSEKGKKSRRISDWKRRGVIGDYEELYNIFLSTNNCNLCNCELNKCNSSRKCLDHDHFTGLFRNILCHTCNTKIKDKKII